MKLSSLSARYQHAENERMHSALIPSLIAYTVGSAGIWALCALGWFIERRSGATTDSVAGRVLREVR